MTDHQGSRVPDTHTTTDHTPPPPEQAPASEVVLAGCLYEAGFTTTGPHPQGGVAIDRSLHDARQRLADMLIFCDPTARPRPPTSPHSPSPGTAAPSPNCSPTSTPTPRTAPSTPDPTGNGLRGYTSTTHHAGHLTPGDQWQPVPDQPPRTVTDLHRRHGVITLTDQYGATWTYPANAVIPTTVLDPLHIHTSTTTNSGTR